MTCRWRKQEVRRELTRTSLSSRSLNVRHWKGRLASCLTASEGSLMPTQLNEAARLCSAAWQALEVRLLQRARLSGERLQRLKHAFFWLRCCRLEFRSKWVLRIESGEGFPPRFYFFYLSASMHAMETCGGQRTTRESQFSLSSRWVVRLELGLAGLAASTFPH